MPPRRCKSAVSLPMTNRWRWIGKARRYPWPAATSKACRDGDVVHWKGQDSAALDSAELTTWLTDSASAPHGGESVDQLCARVAQWMQSLQTESGQVVAITHPFVIRAAMLYVMQFPVSMFYRIDVEPLSCTELRFNGVWRLRLETHA